MSKHIQSPLSRGLAVGLAVVAFTALFAGCVRQISASPGTGGQTPVVQPLPKAPAGREIATLAAGCFWSNEAVFKQLKGVDSVMPGYGGGNVPSPSYEEVCTGTTGFAESVQITFNPKVISYHDLLTVLFKVDDPTTLDRQGEDEGTQYRSAIFYQSPKQKAAAQQAVKEYETSHPGSKVVTEIVPFTSFFAAEEYHRDYYARHPYEGYCEEVIAPKIAKFRENFASKLKE